jgi:hypothetical protein
MRTLSPLLLAFLLSACAAFPSADPAPVIVPCDAPVVLPDRALSDQDIERLWGRDRSALRDCAGRVAALG